MSDCPPSTRDHPTMDRIEASQRKESLGDLAAKIAHDFNNNLTIIRSYAELMLKDMPESDPLRMHATEIRKAADQAAALARQILAFASNRAIENKVFSINRVLKEMHEMLRMNVGENIKLSVKLGPDLGNVKADPGMLFQCVNNLVSNARDAIEGAGVITIKTENLFLDSAGESAAFELAPGHYVMVEVRDTGSGIQPELAEKIFDPYFTTKAPGRGTGLGLAAVGNFFGKNGGAVTVASKPGAGTAIRACLPRVYEAAEPEVLVPLEPEKSGLGEKILLVEDEPAVLAATKQILTQAGYSVITAKDGQAALELFDKRKKPVDLVLTDVRMPGMNGRELVERLREKQPELRAVFMSGYSSDVIPRGNTREKGFYFIEKPYSMENLRRKLREALDAQDP